MSEIGYLQDDTKVIADRLIVISIFVVIFIDFIFFHDTVDYFLKTLFLQEEFKQIVKIGFLLGYIAIEVYTCYKIYYGWKNSEKYRYNTGAKVQKWLFSIGGFIFACIPAVLFYCVRATGKDKSDGDISELDRIFTYLNSRLGGQLVTLDMNDEKYKGERSIRESRALWLEAGWHPPANDPRQLEV
jgi:hypothetical protein